LSKMNGNITKEYLDGICLSLNAQFESVDAEVRWSSEKRLNEFAKDPEFIRCSLLMLANAALQANTKKALAILLDKKIMSLSCVREFDEEELKQNGLMFVEALCEEKIELELKPMIQNCIQSMTYVQIEGTLMT
jgi:archaellum biogenesis ATPase FlaH